MDIINENLIAVDVELSSKEEALNYICDMLDDNKRLCDKALYLKDVLEREAIEQTALGFTFAIPHAKSKGVILASLVFIRLKNEIIWGNDEKVKYIFGIAVPFENTGNVHLDIIAMLSRKMMSDEFRQALDLANDKKQYLNLIVNIA